MPGTRLAIIVLPAPGGPTMQEVVAAGGGDLQRAPGEHLPAHLGEVRRVAGRAAAGANA